jgi:hypothetical protein
MEHLEPCVSFSLHHRCAARFSDDFSRSRRVDPGFSGMEVTIDRRERKALLFLRSYPVYDIEVPQGPIQRPRTDETEKKS